MIAITSLEMASLKKSGHGTLMRWRTPSTKPQALRQSETAKTWLSYAAQSMSVQVLTLLSWMPPITCALLIWLPEFSNANNYWDIPNDGRDAGWIWVEATGSSNPLGWTPPDFEDGGGPRIL